MAEEIKKPEEVKTPVETIKAAITPPVMPPVTLPPPVVEPPVESAEEKKVRLRQRIDKLIARPTVSAPVSGIKPVEVKKEEEKTPAQLLAEGDTLGAMQLVADRSAKAERERVMSELTSEDQVRTAQDFRNKANALVWEKHPEVLDVDEGLKKVEEVPFYSEIQKVYREHPEFIYLPNGPVMAMELAEARFNVSETTKKAKQEGAQQENVRAANVSAASVISSAGASGIPSSSSVPALSSDEQVTARKMGLSDTEFAQYKKKGPVTGPDYYKKFSGLPKPKAS